METIESLLKRYRSGETIYFGEGVLLSQDGLVIDGDSIELNTIRLLRLDEQGNIVIQRIGATEAWLLVPAAIVDSAVVMLDAVNQLVRDVPYLERRSVTGWPPASVGDISARLGYDVRELKMAEYSEEEIQSVLYDRRTLEDLLERGPRKGRASKRKK